MNHDVLDVHTHLANWRAFPNRFLDGVTAGIESSAGAASLVRKIFARSMNDDGTRLIEQMDEAGIARAVLLVADYGLALGEAAWSIEEHNRRCAQIAAAHPDRFVWFAGVDPRRGSSGVTLMERAVGEWNCAGLKLYPPCGFELDDESLTPLYRLCEQAGIPILTHTGPSLGELQIERKFPESVERVCERFGDLKIILAHGLLRTFEECLALAGRFEHVYFDISAFQVFWPDEAKLGMRLREACDRAPGKALFGTDWPLYLLKGRQKDWVAAIQRCETLTSSEKADLLAGNARRVVPALKRSF